MAFGFGGPGAGPGGHGGPGGPGGHGGPGGPGGHGPGPGGFHGGFHGGGFHGGFFGGFFGFGHFGFNSNNTGSARGAASVDPASDNISPASVIDTRSAPDVKSRVDLFIINFHSLKRARRWLYAITVFSAILIALAAANFRATRLFSLAFIPSALAYSLRNLVNELYGCPTANASSLFASLLAAFGLCIVIPFGGSPHVFLAGLAAFLVASLVSNSLFRISRISASIRGFDNDDRCFRRRSLGASTLGRLVELLVFLSLAFAGQLSFPALVRLGLANFIFATALESALSPLFCLFRNYLAYRLSAVYDYLTDA